jgi:hypothetical protein
VPESLAVEEGVDGEGLVSAGLSVDRDSVGGVFFRVMLLEE